VGLSLGQRALKLRLYERERGVCPVSGERGEDMAHVFIPKSILKGAAAMATYNERNLILSSHQVNMRWSRRERLIAAEYLVGLYGVEEIQEWVNGLNMSTAFSVAGWMASLRS